MNQARGAPADQPEASRSGLGAIFLVGMFTSGTELLGGALSRLGLRRVGDDERPWGEPTLTSFNDRLLVAAGAGEDPPDVAPGELAHLLARYLDEARQRMTATLGTAALDPDALPWVWAEPRLSFLTPFWSDALGLRPAVILVHREPGQLAGAEVPAVADATKVVRWWDRYNRSALVLCSQFPSLVLNYDDVVGRPKVVLTEIVEFLAGVGVSLDGDLADAIAFIERVAPRQHTEVAAESAIEPRYRTLDRLLTQLDGRWTGDRADDARPGLVDVTAEFYDADYYSIGYDRAGVPYSRDEKVWVDFFAAVAGSLVKTLRPHTVLDVGCALGMLVEAFRERGVDARGIDISVWAIGQIPAAIQPFCRVGSLTEEIDGHYDLITCVEVLEHLPPTLADAGVGNLCRHADTVLFSSTPDDFAEPTHLNVEPTSYWAQLFHRHGFVRDLDFDSSFLAPHAMLFRRQQVEADALVVQYERALWQATSDLHARLLQYEELAETHNQTVSDAQALGVFEREVRRLDEALESLQRRRAAENVASFDKVREFEAGQRRLAALLNTSQAELEEIRNTKTFRYTTGLRGLYERRRRRRVPVTHSAPSVFPPDGSYQTWIDLFDTLDDQRRAGIEARVRALPSRPTISVIMPVYNPPAHLLRDAIDSVRHQIYQDWELCIADDCSTDVEVVRVLEECAASDERIKIVRRQENGHISAASNSALSVATGQWVAPLDHDDLLAEHALALVALALSDRPEVGIVYSDEDKLDESGDRCSPFFKPDFDPLLLVGQNFVSHLSAFRKDLVDQVGGYREGYEGSQDWDLTLRVSELIEPRQVLHIPHVLYHWRAHASSTASLVSAKPYAVDAGRRAVLDHVRRTGRSARVTRIGKAGHVRVSWDLPDPAPMVSIVIPTRDGRLLQRCIDSVLGLTIYPDFEVIVVDNSSRTLSTLEYLNGYDDRITVIRDERPFNFAALNNHAVDRTSGDVVCFLNDDTEAITGEWLTEMVSQLLQPGVGAVGAKLYYDDGRIQHAGVVVGIYGVAGHAHRMFDRLSPGYSGHLWLPHRMSAVTAACTAVRREAWDQVHGFDEKNLPIAFNDVDFCLRLREAGWAVVWTPYAELFHRESISRGSDFVGPRSEDFAREVAYMEARWGFEGLRDDPCYNPNLALDAEDFSLAWPPRVSLDEPA